jgi:protein-tyrosine-phosphatase
MKTVLAIFVCLNAAVAVGIAAFLGERSLTTRSSVRTSGAGTWSSQKKVFITQLRQALDTARQSNDEALKKQLKRLTAETNALIAEITQSNEAKDLPSRVAKLLEQLGPSSSIVVDPQDDLARTRKELTEQADALLQKAEAALESSSRATAPKIVELREAVEQFKREVASAGTANGLDSLREGKLKDLDHQSAAIVAEATGGELSWGTVMAGIALVLVLGVSASLAITIYYVRTSVIDLENGFRAYKEPVNALTNKMSDAQASLAILQASLARTQQDFREQIAAVRRNNDKGPNPETIKPPVIETERPFLPPPPLEPIEVEPSFPALVSEYVSRVGESRKRCVENDFHTNILTPCSDQSAPFVYIGDDDDLGAGIVLPKPRLQRGQDFSTHYKLYYTCAEPSAGDVYILSPATVERVDTGWRLLEMGRMEIH